MLGCPLSKLTQSDEYLRAEFLTFELKIGASLGLADSLFTKRWTTEAVEARSSSNQPVPSSRLANPSSIPW